MAKGNDANLSSTWCRFLRTELVTGVDRRVKESGKQNVRSILNSKTQRGLRDIESNWLSRRPPGNPVLKGTWTALWEGRMLPRLFSFVLGLHGDGLKPLIGLSFLRNCRSNSLNWPLYKLSPIRGNNFQSSSRRGLLASSEFAKQCVFVFLFDVCLPRPVLLFSFCV